MESGRPYSDFRKTRADSSNYGKMPKRRLPIDNNGFRYPKTVLRFDRDKPQIFPTQKPVALFQYLLKTYSTERALVLDCCMGSGTTAIAASNTGRNFVGFELDRGIYEKATQRIRDHQRMLRRQSAG